MSNLTTCMKCGKGYLYDHGHTCPMDTLHDIPDILEKKLEKEKAHQRALKEHQEELTRAASIRGHKNKSNRVRKNKMRNKPCVCGSGKKFKKCCWSKYK